MPVNNRGRERGRLSAFRYLLISTSALAAVALTDTSPGAAQTAATGQAATDQGQLPPINVAAPHTKPRSGKKSGTPVPAPPAPTAEQTPATPPPQSLAGIPITPLHGVAASSTRLGLPIIETPASVDVVTQQTMREQGYRTTSEIAKGAVGVLDLDSAGAPANFSMRGFTFGEVNVLYNGISIGVASDTTRVMDTANLDQVEFLKGPSALMSGMMAIGGSVNYVSRQPTTGPVQNEVDLSVDSLGTFRSHFGSGGSTTMEGLDYRFDATASNVNSFVEGDYRDLTDLATQFNYRVNNNLMTFVAIDYKKDSGHAYWGTPIVPTSFAGANAVSGVVTGAMINTFTGAAIGPVTIDSQTLTTNYNVADNATGAQELWLRSGAEWTPLNNVTVKDQVYYYQAKRNWLDSETYAFDDGSQPSSLGINVIDRDRFFVDHNQHVVGNNIDFLWDSRLFGMDNRLAAQLQVSGDWITFTQEGDPSDYPYDDVSVIDPAQGVYGPQFPDVFNKQLDNVAVAVEDRLKITSAFALIGGVRVDDWTLSSNNINFDGTTNPGEPFTQVWKPVSYRAAYTYEPIPDMTFYSMYATSYDPAVADVFTVDASTPLALTSAAIYETGVKQLLWDNKAEWTFAAYDITRRNVYVPITDTTSALAGEIGTKGYELAGAVRPIEGFKLWGNVAWTHARYENFNAFDFSGNLVSWTGNTPSNVAPIIVNAGASYRFDHWRWPLEIGGSVRHVGNRDLFEDDATIMDAYTTADVYAFVDIPGKDVSWLDVNSLRVTFRVRNLTNAVYAAYSDPGYPDQVYLGDPRTYELAASAKW
ncbi:MAG TPA: TonB-dependent receptor [Xanthobacteraceae bacterium]|nr:TonB-dependent receptor [Xanthobacteraceae bacterium]